MVWTRRQCCDIYCGSLYVFFTCQRVAPLLTTSPDSEMFPCFTVNIGQFQQISTSPRPEHRTATKAERCPLLLTGNRDSTVIYYTACPGHYSGTSQRSIAVQTAISTSHSTWGFAADTHNMRQAIVPGYSTSAWLFQLSLIDNLQESNGEGVPVSALYFCQTCGALHSERLCS